MRGTRRHAWFAIVALIAMLGAACGGGRGGGGQAGGDYPDPGIDDEVIKIGGSHPFSGPASAYGVIGNSIGAYFDYVNEELGGVEMGDGTTRTIEWTVLDDGYQPPRALENARRLIEQDRVFALFNTLGTPTNSAIWDYVNQQEVPHLFVATGASKWGADPDSHPWTIGWQPAYTTESAIYAEWLETEQPGARVAVLFQNDDYGRDYLTGFEKAIEGKDIQIVARQSYAVEDPTVDSQVTELARSDANVFFNITTPKFAAQAITRAQQLGWEVTHLLNSVSASKTAVLEPAGLDASQGLVTANYIKDSGDPQWADDEGMQNYLERIERFGADINPLDAFAVYGFAVAETLVKVLEETEEPTRESLMEAARNINELEVSLLLPGIVVDTDPDDAYPIEQMQLQRFEGEQWQLFGDILSFEDRTPTGVEE